MLLSKGTQLRLNDLTKRTGTAERQIRYLISEGFVPPPRGGRANADYGEDHVEAVIRYARLKDLGFPPAAIRLLLGATAGAPFLIAKGITLVIDPAQLGSGADIEPIIQSTRDVLSHALGKSTHSKSSGDTDA
jgi:MerR family copper efflux transcriptional regulator